jgi:hypothetical protein
VIRDILVGDIIAGQVAIRCVLVQAGRVCTRAVIRGEHRIVVSLGREHMGQLTDRRVILRQGGYRLDGRVVLRLLGHGQILL